MVRAITLVDRSIAPEWLSSSRVSCRSACDAAAIRQSTLQDPAVLNGPLGADYYKTVEQLLANAAPLSQGPSGEEMIQAVGTELNEAVAGRSEERRVGKECLAVCRSRRSEERRVGKECLCCV